VQLEAILADPAVRNEVIRSEMTAIKEEFATPRICQIGLDDGEMTDLDLVEDKELVIVMTEAQYVKAVTADSFKTQGRGGRGVSGAKLKTDDIVHHVIFTTAHAFLLFFSNRGRVYRLRAMDFSASAPPRACRSSTSAVAGGRTIGDHRHPRLRRWRNLFFAARLGVVKKTSFHEVRQRSPRWPDCAQSS
jgi:DNA gyrase subunit A